jgi:hypothetical protein
MVPFEILLIHTTLFSEKFIASITQRKMKFIEVKQNMFSAEAINYTAVYMDYRMEI